MRDRRAETIREVVNRIVGIPRTSPVRVAIDGRTAGIEQTGRPVIRASIDGFHRPRVERYRRGRMSAEGYYRDARDLGALVSLLLAPLATDPWQEAIDAVLIVDGTFLQRPEPATHWDAVIFVRTSPALCLNRGIDRDSAHLGGPAKTRRMYAERYQPAYEIYEREASPKQGADLILDNNDPTRPTIHARLGGRLPRVTTTVTAQAPTSHFQRE